MENSTKYTTHSPQTVLLKADTGANVNLMNKQTLNQLFGEAKVLQLTPIRMENYGNTAVKVLGMFHVFLSWKDKVYKHVMLGMLVTYWVFSNLVTLWKIPQIPQTLHMHQTKMIWQLNHFFIRK